MVSGMRHIAVVTGSRADYCPLKYVIEQLGEQAIHIPLKGMYGAELALPPVLTERKPDIVLLLGDRYETLIVATVAAEMRIPIAHVGGGEETQGATDEAFRHAITKLAYYHFVAHQDFADKVIQMGERPDRVFVTGDPQVDGIAYHEKNMYFQGTRPWTAIAYNPETLGDDEANLRAITAHRHRLGGFCIGIASPNLDHGHQKVMDYWDATFHPGKAQTWEHDHWVSILKQADYLIGNSSSFCIEAMTLGKKVIMIGDRQKGRWEQAKKHFAENPYAYGKPGEVSKAIVDKLLTLPIPDKPRKPFYSQ